MGDGGRRQRDAVAGPGTSSAQVARSARPLLLRHLRAVVAVGACVGIWVSRRPEQLTRPYVWAEESIMLQNYVQHGWSAALEPVNGSLNLPAPLLISVSAWLGVSQFAAVNAVLAVGVFTLTTWILVVPDSLWGGFRTRVAMAAGMALCPVDPEVFGVLLYSFWWATLWPLIILGWVAPHWVARIPLLVVAALSSPAAGALFVLFAIRHRIRRSGADLVSAAVLASGLIVEFAIAVSSGRTQHLTHDQEAVPEQMARTLGVFMWPWTFGAERRWDLLAVLGVLLIGVLVAVALRGLPPERRSAGLLAGGGLIYAFFSALPAPLISDPRDAGPRYYFLPFVALLWLLVHLATSPGRTLRDRLVIGLVGTSALTGVLPVAHRMDRYRWNHLDWPTEIDRCAASAEVAVDVPVYFDGSKRLFLPHLLLRPADCRRYR